MTQDLPHGLGPPLHVLPPEAAGGVPWGWISLSILLLASLALWSRWRRRRRSPASVPKPRPEAPSRSESHWVSRVHRIWQEYREGQDLRHGLAELSRLLRDYFARRLPGVDPHPGLTVRRLARQAHGETAFLLHLVNLHRFGRREPKPADFDQIFELALEVLGREANTSATTGSNQAGSKNAASATSATVGGTGENP